MGATMNYYQIMSQEKKEKRNAQMLEYNDLNRDRLKKYRNEYCLERKKTDPLFKLKSNLSNNLRAAIRNQHYGKRSCLYKLIGLPWEDFKTYFENQFTDEMQWEMPRGFEVQHIIPLSSAKTEEELKSLFIWTNLIPLTPKENKLQWKEDRKKYGL